MWVGHADISASALPVPRGLSLSHLSPLAPISKGALWSQWPCPFLPPWPWPQSSGRPGTPGGAAALALPWLHLLPPQPATFCRGRTSSSAFPGCLSRRQSLYSEAGPARTALSTCPLTQLIITGYPGPSLRVTRALSKSCGLQLQHFPVAHHLHIHQAGLSCYHLPPKPGQSLPPHGLPCFCSHTPQPVHIRPLSHTRPLPLLGLLPGPFWNPRHSPHNGQHYGMRPPIAFLTSLQPCWPPCRGLNIPIQSPAPGPLDLLFNLPGSSFPTYSAPSWLTCYPLEAFPDLLLNPLP